MNEQELDKLKSELNRLSKVIDEFVENSSVLDINDFGGEIHTADAQLYKCYDEHGRPYWQEEPCP